MTTTDLVPVFAGTLAGQSTPLCNARDLHATLGVGRDFTTWIKERIAEYGFIEGDDFLIDSPKRGNQTGRGGDRRSRDYHLTLGMAKELAMIENNDTGRQVRRYFIAVEKASRAKEANLPALPPPRRIRSRDDLSFTARDSEGRLLNWQVPSRANQWHEHVGIGEEWFAEVVQLALHNPQEAYNALLFSGAALLRTWGHGHEQGFMDHFARWAIAAIVANNGVTPSLPFEPRDMGIPPREGFEHYRRMASAIHGEVTA